MDRLTSILTTRKFIREQRFRFELYEQRGDICHLRFMALKKDVYVSPPCKPYKFASIDHTMIGTELVLLGCNICSIPNGITINNPKSCDYIIDTDKGHCGRPAVTFCTQFRRLYYNGLHRFGGVNGSPNSYEPWVRDEFNFSIDDEYMIGESVEKVYKLRGNPSIVQTEFMEDPMAKFIPESWLDRSLYELKEMSVDNTIKGVQKYNRYPNWEVQNEPHFTLVYEIWYNMWSWTHDCFATPATYEDWLHVMMHGGQDAKKHSSPGYPFNQDCYDKITWLTHHGRALYDSILDGSVVDTPAIATNSQKDEVRACSKDPRMFAGMPIHHTGVGVFLFHSHLAKIKSLRRDPNVVFSYGLNLTEMADLFGDLFRADNKGQSYDVNGCDTSVPTSAQLLIHSMLRLGVPIEYHPLFDWMATNNIYTFLKNPDQWVWKKNNGTCTGTYLTVFLNAMWASLVEVMTFVKLLMKTPYRTHLLANPVLAYKAHHYTKITGDDTLVVYRRPPYFTKEEINGALPKHVDITFDYPDIPISSKTEVTFLSLKITNNVLARYRHVANQLVHAKPERMLVKMLYKRKSHDHTVFYQKLCNALTYMIFDSVWHHRLVAVKQAVEVYFDDHQLEYVYRSLNDLEVIRGIKVQEILSGIEQGMPLNDISQFKTMSVRQTKANKAIKVRSANAELAAMRRELNQAKQALNGLKQSGQAKNKNNKRKRGGKKKTSDFQMSQYAAPQYTKALNKRIVRNPDFLPAPVEAAYSNLFTVERSVNPYPAPIACSNKYFLTARVTGEAGKLTNWRTAVDPKTITFENYLIQTGNPFYPVLSTFNTGDTKYAFANNYEAGTPVTKMAWIEVYENEPWGIWSNSRLHTFQGILSRYLPVDGYPTSDQHAHVWTAHLPAATAGQIAATVNWTSADRGLEFKVFLRINSNPWASVTSAQGIASFLLGVPTSDAFLQWAVYIESRGFAHTKIGMHMTYAVGQYAHNLCLVKTGPSNALPVGFTTYPYNLHPLIETNFQNIAERTSASRKHCSHLVYTQSISKWYRGGNALCANIYSNEPIRNSNYESYLFSTPKSVLLDFAEGATTCWWASMGDFVPRTPASYPINTLACPDIATCFQVITNQQMNDAGNNELVLQVKLYEYHDYTTSDMTLNPIEVISYNDDWSRIMAIIAKEYRFTCNPEHQSFLEKFQQFVKFMMSGDERAVAMRRAGLKAAQLAGAALLSAM